MTIGGGERVETYRFDLVADRFRTSGFGARHFGKGTGALPKLKQYTTLNNDASKAKVADSWERKEKRCGVWGSGREARSSIT